jgi:hypothetical protein
MPIYYFDLWQENRVVRDETGVQCPDIETLLRAARGAIREFRADALANGKSVGAAQILVRNEAGKVIAVLELEARKAASHSLIH